MIALNKKVSHLAIKYKDSELACSSLQMDVSTLQAELGKQNSKN